MLTTPPLVRIGSDPTWRETSFDLTTAPEDVQRGPQKLPREGKEWLRWTVYLGDDPAQVVQLLACGPDLPVGSRGPAVVVPVGSHVTTLRIDRGDERILREGDRPLQVG